MNYAWDAIVHNLAHVLTDMGGVDVQPEDLVPPPDPKLGDIAFGCFKLAKIQGKSPAAIAQELAGKLKEQDLNIESATAAGPYVNIVLKTGELMARIIKDVEMHGDQFGKSEMPQKHHAVFEYANPNTHKEIHIGHLRNFMLGASLCRILTSAGFKLTPVSYVNDMGTNVSKCLWKLVKSQGLDPQTFAEGSTLEKLLQGIPTEKRSGKYLGLLYTEAVQELADHPELLPEVSFVHLKLEAHDPVWMELFQKTRQWCIEELRQIFSELGVRIEQQYLESHFVQRSQEIVRELEEKKIATVSEDALIVQFEDEKLGVVVLRKTDGSLLYLSKDLALAEQKIRDYPDADSYYIVTDKRQELNFKQLFALLEKMGHHQNFKHIGYELVTLKEGAMSSRKGNIVTWQQFRDDVYAYAFEQTQARHPDWPEGKISDTAWRLMIGGIAFGILRQDPDRVYVFDKEQALSFEGATGPYIQYAATRLASILRKAEWTKEKGMERGELTRLTNPIEKYLAVSMAQLPGVIARAATELRPSLVAQWCLDMAARTNDFYRDVKVLEGDAELQAARLRLVAAARQALSLGLSHLGIPLPEEM